MISQKVVGVTLNIARHVITLLSILHLAGMFYIIYIKKIFDWSKNEYIFWDNFSPGP